MLIMLFSLILDDETLLSRTTPKTQTTTIKSKPQKRQQVNIGQGFFEKDNVFTGDVKVFKPLVV
jgi:hypothetical protein